MTETPIQWIRNFADGANARHVSYNVRTSSKAYEYGGIIAPVFAIVLFLLIVFMLGYAVGNNG